MNKKQNHRPHRFIIRDRFFFKFPAFISWEWRCCFTSIQAKGSRWIQYVIFSPIIPCDSINGYQNKRETLLFYSPAVYYIASDAVCGNERTRVSALSNILLGARGIGKNKMKSTGRRRRPGRRRMLRTASLSDRPKFTVRKKSVIIGLRDAELACATVYMCLYIVPPHPSSSAGRFLF